jgi:hypothetical protein
MDWTDGPRERFGLCRFAVALPNGPGLQSVSDPARGPTAMEMSAMITCVVNYVIDPGKSEAFEEFARRWMSLVNRNGGVHHGYFLPAEGASDRALALFSFESLATYEKYRARFGIDPEFIAADRIRDESRCVIRHERTFMRPLLPEPEQG